jgi:hypothetical protein
LLQIFVVLKLLLTLYFLFFILFTKAQVSTTTLPTPILVDTNKVAIAVSAYKILLDTNRFLNARGLPQALSILPKKEDNKQIFFYLFAFLFLILGITRSFFSRYFSTLFSVFFNSTLKQNQLTDQLEQAKLPSLIFNIFFIVTTGLYVFFLVKFNSLSATASATKLMLACIAAVGISYFVKYLSLKFTGWLTSYSEEANTYIFIIFLLNKMIGLFLLPVVTIMAFCKVEIVSVTILFSLIVLAVIFLVRFFRSYSLLQSKLKVSPFHFILYVTSLEILPILLIYKLVSNYLLTNT